MKDLSKTHRNFYPEMEIAMSSKERHEYTCVWQIRYPRELQKQ